MMRRRLCTSIAGLTGVRYASDESVAPKPSKMQTLHKLLTGEVQLKNKAPLKHANITLVFGDKWETEAAAYAKTLTGDEQAVFSRQIQRLSLTRYTARELAQYGGNGPAGVDAAAKAGNVAEGAAMLAAKGDAEFTNHVMAEAKLSNWSNEQAKQFITAAKAVKK